MTHHLPRTCNVNATCERTLMKSDLFIDVNMWQTPFCAAEDSAVGEKEEGPVTVGGKPSLVGYCQLRMEQNNHKEEEEEKSDEHLTWTRRMVERKAGLRTDNLPQASEWPKLWAMVSDQEEEARKKEKKMEEKEDREEFAAVEKKTPTGEKNMEEKKENKEFVTDDQEEEARKKEKKMEEKEDREEFATVVRSSRDKSTRPQRSSKGFLCCSRAGADDTD
ncbi:uncharacterized protein [Engystomops pustulosus]|uniref:uncharacterized protein isoform X2 n=1 Tax=Engystomops pustulosus TaxID=76066 RepID=UPI003AFAB841